MSDLQSTFLGLRKASADQLAAIEKSAAQLKELHSHVDKTLHHIEKVKETLGLRDKPLTCAICFVDAVTFSVSPCGHCFCRGCAARALSDHVCFSCRSRVRTMSRIYL